MTVDTHKILDFLQHLGVYLGGVVAVFVAVFGFWWRDKMSTRSLIDKNMAVVLDELKEIREDIKTDAKEARTEAAANLKGNQEAHTAILKTMNTLHSKTNDKIMSLHAK